MIKSIFWKALLIISFLFVSSGCCEEYKFEPARLKTDFDAFDGIEIPAVGSGKEVRIYCFSGVTKKGKFNPVFCRSDTSGVDEFLSAVTAAARRFSAYPARVGGRRKKVLFSFTLVAKPSGDNSGISIFSHAFMNYKEYGDDYVAPQAYRYPNLSWSGCDFEVMAWVEVSIDENGVATGSRLINGSGSDYWCFERLKNIALNTKYIPAFFQGKSVPSKYVIPFFASPNFW